MAPVVFLQEDEDVPSVYHNLKIFVKRPPGPKSEIKSKVRLGFRVSVGIIELCCVYGFRGKKITCPGARDK